MKYIENVHGSEAQAKPIIVGKTLVYVHDNIRKVTVVDEFGEREEYIYNETQYTKNEWIDVLTKQNETLKETIDDMDLQIAMVQVDTEFLMCLEELNEEGGE